jgi:ABC-2 type transport system ATP-binding protein
MDHTTPPEPTPPTAAVAVRGLCKTWPGGVRAVAGIDFDVATGEVFGLLGPNGAGKSTTIGMLTTTVVPTAGRAYVAGHDVAREPIAARAASAVVFQDAVVDRALTGRRNLQLHARLWGVEPSDARQRITEHAAHFGLSDLLDRPVATYSGGQRRRLEIARSLVSKPEVLFLDEPTVGLDPRIRYELIDHIAQLRERWGVTVLLTTHYLDEAERLCDRVGIMHVGAIVALDTPASLLAGVGREVLEVRVDGDAEVALQRLRTHGVAGDDAFAVAATITVPMHDRPASEAITAVHRIGIPAVATAARPPTLDDVYLRLTGGRLETDRPAA